MRFLIISDPARNDFYGYLLPGLQRKGEVFLLWDYAKKYANVSVDTIPPGVTILYWNQFSTPFQLLKKIKPDRILFFEILDLWQIPLVIACHHFKITCFFVDHGVGNKVEVMKERFKENPPLYKKLIFFLKKSLTATKKILKSQGFFFSAAKFLDKASCSRYFKLLFYLRFYSPIEALSKLKFRERTPHYAILFNKNNIEPFIFYNEIERENIFTDGVPFFDKYFVQRLEVGSHIVFIEHPYLEESILKWDSKFHEEIARSLEQFAKKNQLKLVVKLHPRSDINNWLRYNLDSDYIVIKQKEDITKEIQSAKIILGYSSTLMNVFIQLKKNIVLLGWHPDPMIFGDDLSKTGLCHVSYSIEDLFTKFSEWQSVNLAEKNTNLYLDFLYNYNYPLDGKATERVINAILVNEAP